MEQASMSGLMILGAVIGMGLASCGGAIGMGMLIAKAIEAMVRQPEQANNVRTTMFIGIAFVEAAILYTLVLSFFIVFVK
jgi:F-type H+-transporting ATPase subunit c